MEKYKEIVEVLKAELAQGKYPVGSCFPSEYELANRFGVAHPTANKAVGELVSAGFLVRGKRGSGTRVCLTEKFPKGRILYVGCLDHLTPCRELKGFSTRAFQRGYYVTATNPPYMELGRFLSKAVATGEFAGIVSYAYHNFNELCPSLPIVYLDNDKFDASLDGHPELNYVTSANQAGSYEMVKYLEGKGYRNIVIYTDSAYQFTERYSRVLGCQKALREMGLADVEERLFVGAEQEYTKVDALMQLRKILRAYPDTDAIVTTADDLALPMRQALMEAGIPSPQQILVTGFGNLYPIQDSYQIPSVEQHPLQIGVVAADMLIDLVEGKPLPKPRHHYVDTTLVKLEFIPYKGME